MSSQETASRVPVVIAGYTVPIVCMVLCTGLRLFVKVRGPSEDRFHADDCLITLATVRSPPYRLVPAHTDDPFCFWLDTGGSVQYYHAGCRYECPRGCISGRNPANVLRDASWIR